MDKSEDIKTQGDTQLKIEIGLNTKIDEKLMEEGNVREVIRSIQACRKKSGFQQGEKVSIEYYTDDKSLSQIINNNQSKIEEAVTGKLNEVTTDSFEGFLTQNINDSSLKLKLNR
jgi:valyl-tRNA synthetase